MDQFARSLLMQCLMADAFLQSDPNKMLKKVLKLTSDVKVIFNCFHVFQNQNEVLNPSSEWQQHIRGADMLVWLTLWNWIDWVAFHVSWETTPSVSHSNMWKVTLSSVIWPVEGKQQTCLWLNCAKMVTWKGWKLPWKEEMMSTQRTNMVGQGWSG